VADKIRRYMLLKEVCVTVVTMFGLLSLAVALLLLVVLAGCVFGLAVAVVGTILAVAVLVLTIRSVRR